MRITMSLFSPIKKMGSVSISDTSVDSQPSSSKSVMFSDQTTTEDFMKTLECPICLEIVVSPVINCTSGHIICSICRPRVDKCGLCGSNYTNIRNYPIEAILALIEAKCRHTSCSQQMRADKLREHLTCCEYRPVACQEYSVVKCNGRLINFEYYPQHLMDVHKTRCKTSDDPEFQRINLSNTLEVKWPIFLLSHRNQTFFLHRKSVVHHLLCWVSMMAKENVAENYCLKLRIRHPHQEDKSMKWNVRAHSVHTPLELVKSAGDCAFIPYEALIPYCERQVMHTTGQVFEFKWTMTIRIQSPPTIDVVSTNKICEADSRVVKEETEAEEDSNEDEETNGERTQLIMMETERLGLDF